MKWSYSRFCLLVSVFGFYIHTQVLLRLIFTILIHSVADFYSRLSPHPLEDFKRENDDEKFGGANCFEYSPPPRRSPIMWGCIDL